MIATCPLTENGFIRLISQPKYGERWLPVGRAIHDLEEFKGSSAIAHAFWQDDLSLRERTLFDLNHVTGPLKLTDVYLLGLAHRHGGRLISFDTRLPWRAVRGAEAGLVENPADTLKT